MTGTSWTTIATIGIALLGIGNALGIPEPFTAGAIISGAYFGDKVSPMSDTTVLASSVSGADLFKHIRCMMHTTVPSITISLLLYLVMGFWFSGERVEPSIYLEGLEHSFNISAWTLLVPVFSGILIWKKVPSFITLILSALAAIVCAIVLQPDALLEIAGTQTATVSNIFTGLLKVCYTSTQLDTGFAEVNNLVATRGMAGMLDTVWLILCAMCFGSCMVASNMLKSLTHSSQDHSQHFLSRDINSCVGCGAQSHHGRPVPFHHHECINLQGRIRQPWLSARTSEPFHRGLCHRHLRSRSVDSLWYDSINGAWCANPCLSSILLLQHHKPHHEHHLRIAWKNS